MSRPRAVLLLIVFVLLGDPVRAAVSYNLTVKMMIDGVRQDELEPAVMELTGERPATIGGAPYAIATRSSKSGTPIQMAEQYVYEHLRGYRLDGVGYQPYPGTGVVPPGRNVIGEIQGTGTTGEIVVIGAHLDERPWRGSAYGADDDASGCSALLYLARTFAGKKFDRTIRFVFFGAEEDAPWSGSGSRFGSGYYAAQSKAAGEHIVAMIAADSLAWNLSNNGYPAVMLIEDDVNQLNPNWEQTTDRVATAGWRWDYYVAITKSLVAVAAHLALIH